MSCEHRVDLGLGSPFKEPPFDESINHIVMLADELLLSNHDVGDQVGGHAGIDENVPSVLLRLCDVRFPENSGINSASLKFLKRFLRASCTNNRNWQLCRPRLHEIRTLKAVFQEPLRCGHGNSNALSFELFRPPNVRICYDCIGATRPVDLHKGPRPNPSLQEFGILASKRVYSRPYYIHPVGVVPTFCQFVDQLGFVFYHLKFYEELSMIMV